MRGRMVAVFTTVFAVAYPIGALAQGWAADHIGARLTVTVAGVGVVVTALILAGAREVQSQLRESAEEVGGEPADFGSEILPT
jgi:MFS family permease